MKKILQFIVMLNLFQHQCNAQTNVYHPFPNSNAEWIINWGTSGCESWQITEYKYEIAGDTSIGLHSYNKLIRSGTFLCANPLNQATDYTGAFRNDVNSKKVFFIAADSSSEALLYDFNLQTGDTVTGYLKQVSDNIAIITSVDSVQIGNSYRKRWVFSSPLWYDGEIIEGIGTSFGLLEGLMPQFDFNGELFCFSENGQVLYGTSPCELVTTINVNLQNDRVVNISPNPASTTFTIQSSATHPQTLRIINVQGQVVYSSIFDVQHSIFDISALQNGLYHLLLEDKQGRVQAKKLVVAR